VHIHASAEELNRVYYADLAICASVNAAAKSLEVLTAPSTVSWAKWAAQANADYVANIQAQTLPGLPSDTLEGLVNMPEVVAVLQKHLPADAVLTNGAGNFASWVHRYYKHHGLTKGFKTQLAPTVGAMGYGVPAGIAASILTGRVCFTISGDGDFLMNGQELATATQYGAASIVVLLNNGMFGTIRMHQEREFPTHNMGSGLRNPHFANLAKAYGYEGVRISKTEEFEPALVAALRSALEDQKGTLIEVLMDPEAITTRVSLSTITQNALNARQSS
jgi:acetolactate synthase-1/2/3 large subunit